MMSRQPISAVKAFHPRNPARPSGTARPCTKRRSTSVATTDAVAVNNAFYNIVGPAVDFQSCLNGVFEGNTIRDSAAGFRVGLAPEQFEGEWKEYLVGLPATRGTVIRDNRLADIAGDTMFLVEQRAREGLVANGNTYYTDGEPVFLLGRRKLTLEEFRRELGVEKDSEVKPASGCQLP